jgi:cytochrome b subunit of formate dehydrogenase
LAMLFWLQGAHKYWFEHQEVTRREINAYNRREVCLFVVELAYLIVELVTGSYL